MKKINKILINDPRYRRWQKPLEAAEICHRARQVSEGQYQVISFDGGLLTLGCSSPAQAANLQTQRTEIMAQINQKIGRQAVKRIRFEII